MYKKAGKTLALIAIAVLIAGGLMSTAYGQVQGTSEVPFSFMVINTNHFPVSGLTVNLENENGVILESNVSSPTVEFNAYPGNYVINIPSQEVNNVVYNNVNLNINVSSNQKVYSVPSGSILSNVVVSYQGINAQLNVKVTGSNQINSVYTELQNGLNLYATLQNSTYVIKTTAGQQTIYIKYYNASNAVYNMMVDASVGNNSINVSLSSSAAIVGDVINTAGSHLNNIQVSIYQNGALLGSDVFSNGYFFVTLPNGQYNFVISSNGYYPQSISATVTSGTTTFKQVTLTPSYSNQVTSITFNNNFNGLTLQSNITITNSTILMTLPYTNAGSLYNQMKLLGLSQGGLWEILNYSIPETTVNTVLFNGYAYNYSYSTSTLVQTFNGTNLQYAFSYTVSYQQQAIKAGHNNEMQLYVNENGASGAYVSHEYFINIPSSYERANLINSSIAQVSGFSNVIKVSNSTYNGFLSLKIDQKVKPTVNPTELNINWNGYFESTVLNDSISNYTVIVPASKAVTYNASNAVFDNVLGMDNYQQMTFFWNFGNGITSNSYTANVTLMPGTYQVTLTVTDVGGNTNQTTFTVISDAQTPQLNLAILQNGKNVLTVNTTTSNTYTLWVNQSVPVYFNALNSKDLLSNGMNTKLPLVLNWNISGSAKTGYNVSYAFIKPTFNGKFVYTNVTVKNAVGNSISVVLQVHVNDTTPPVASFQVMNTSGKVITSAKEYQDLILNASKSFAPNGGYLVSYNWSIYYSNGTKAKVNVAYNIVQSSSNNSTLEVSFIQYGTFKINLQVTDQSGNKGNDTVSIFVSAVAPEIEILNVTYPNSYTEGSSAILKLELKNVGLQNATEYYVNVTLNGKVIKNVSFTNLAAGQTINETITIIPPNSGQYTMVVSVFAKNQPSFFNTNVKVTKAISVAQAPWKLPALIGGIIVAIGVLSFLYYDFAIRRKAPKEKKEQKKQLK